MLELERLGVFVVDDLFDLVDPGVCVSGTELADEQCPPLQASITRCRPSRSRLILFSEEITTCSRSRPYARLRGRAASPCGS